MVFVEPRGVFTTLLIPYDGALLQKYVMAFSSNYCRKEFLFDWVLNISVELLKLIVLQLLYSSFP